MTTKWIVKPFPGFATGDWWSIFRVAESRNEYLRHEKTGHIRRFKHHADALALAAKLNSSAPFLED